MGPITGHKRDSAQWDTAQKASSSIDYDNFKNKIAETSSQQEKLSAYGDIWSIMYMLQGRDDPDPETED